MEKNIELDVDLLERFRIKKGYNVYVFSRLLGCDRTYYQKKCRLGYKPMLYLLKLLGVQSLHLNHIDSIYALVNKELAKAVKV